MEEMYKRIATMLYIIHAENLLLMNMVSLGKADSMIAQWREKFKEVAGETFEDGD